MLTEEHVRDITLGETFGQNVSASNYQQLDITAASYIGQCGGGRGNRCDLSGLIYLDEGCAREIARFGGALNLNSIEELSNRVAGCLATQGHQVDLCYRGVSLESWHNVNESVQHVSLLEHIVKVANKKEQPVVLPGIRRIQVKAANMLGKCHELTLGVETLDSKTAKKLAEVRHLKLPRLNINEEIARAWRVGSRALSLGRYAEIDLAVADMLADLIGPGGNLSLPNVKKLNESVAKIIGKTKSLSLNGLKTLSPKTALNLAAVERLSLNGLTTLSPEAARNLVSTTCSENCRTITMNGIEDISEQVAVELSRFKGVLVLRGIDSLSSNVATAFCRYQGAGLDLNSLRKISTDDATALLANQSVVRYDIKKLSQEAFHAIEATRSNFRDQRASCIKARCPKCGKPLRSESARQCFQCGANWRTEG